MIVSDLFRALGDPTRLEMVRRLADETQYTISSISRGLPITRQGARKHLQVLIDSDVISLRQHGRETTVHLNKETIRKGKAFIAELEQLWDKRLAALKDFVENGE